MGIIDSLKDIQNKLNGTNKITVRPNFVPQSPDIPSNASTPDKGRMIGFKAGMKTQHTLEGPHIPDSNS